MKCTGDIFALVTPQFPHTGMPHTEDYFQIPLRVAEKLGLETQVLCEIKYETAQAKKAYEEFGTRKFRHPLTLLHHMLRLNPALVHAHSSYPGSYYSSLFCRKAIFTSHGLIDDKNSPAKSRVQRIERATQFALNKFKKVVCVTPYEEREYNKRGVEKTILLPNPVDSKFLSKTSKGQENEFREEHGVSEDKIVLHTSLIWEIKDPFTILEAHKQLRKDGGDSALVFAGPLHFRKEKNRFLRECKATPGVYLTGWLDLLGLRKALSAADAFVISSTWETQCIAAYEAAAAGVPLCLSNIPTLSSAFGGLAEYHRPGDSKMLAKNIQKTIEIGGKKLRKPLLKFGKSHDSRAYAKRLEQIYLDCLNWD
jgi:glycosyltransferase involved in cell wall biosynthesis